ncbi:MAG: hypothetical protein KDE27_04530, partial [Planctomycetes bacterium]|nr:hypothetical protein [Planctomycetota bacterium]
MTGYRNVLLAALVASSPLGAFATGRGPQANPAWVEAHWRVLHGRPGVSLRGLAVVDARTLWATGSGGTVLRSLDGGASWRDVGPAAARGDELRDVHAFDAETALAMTAGDSSRLYRTSDGGASWTVVHQDDAFFDTIEFAGSRGVLFGDPTDELPYVWSSVDAGASWQRLMGLPAAIAGEAGFAASGSCASVAGAAIRIVTGGTATRCLATTDGGVAWRATQLPLAHGEPSQGAFAVAFRGGHGVAVGGDYREPTRSVGTAAWTDDGGASWHPADALGYRSGVAWLDDQHVLAVGEQGASLSVDRGRTWRPFGDAGFHVVHAAADGSVFAAGGDGRIAMLAPPQPFTVMPLFGSHMVLPPDDTVVLRGTGTPGEQVAVASSWGGAATAHIDAAGRWRCPLATPPRGGTHSITLRAGTETIALDDVLIGDVWLASGQSNMEMTVGFSGGWRQGVLNWEAEVAAADLPELRMFTVEKAASGTPLDVVAGEWQVCSPATASGFSAAAYFCARELLRRGHGPIGVVVSSWGGTVCEAWTSGEALAPFPEFEAALAATRAPVRPWAERALEFWQAVPGWSGAAALATAEDVALPAVWSQDGLGDFDGVAFYRRRVELPAELRGRELALELGAIDDMDTVWCNGVRIGGMEREGAWATPRSYTLPANATAGAVLELVVRVLDTGGEGGFSGTPAAMKLAATESADGAGGAGELSLAG